MQPDESFEKVHALFTTFVDRYLNKAGGRRGSEVRRNIISSFTIEEQKYVDKYILTMRF